MNYKLLLFAALALIAASCTKENVNIEPQPRTVTVTATMAPDDAQTRVSLTPDVSTGKYGLILKWENGDKLMLNFKYNANYYQADAPIVPGSISADGKTAKFTITVPTEIPADATFDLYGVYQKTDANTSNGGYFNAGTNTYELEKSETQCITLDKLGSLGNGITRPMLYFSQTGIANTATPAINAINLAHSGWIMAVHLKNTSGAEINLPAIIDLDARSAIEWAWNGLSLTVTKFDVAAKTFSTTSGNADRALRLSINEYNWLPLYGQKLANGASITFFRWVASIQNVPTLKGYSVFGGRRIETPTNLPAKTVANGNVYHVYTQWDGTNFNFVAAY